MWACRVCLFLPWQAKMAAAGARITARLEQKAGQAGEHVDVLAVREDPELLGKTQNP